MIFFLGLIFLKHAGEHFTTNLVLRMVNDRYLMYHH